MHKEQIDADAEREAKALKKQGRLDNTNRDHTRLADDYNADRFRRLFETLG